MIPPLARFRSGGSDPYWSSVVTLLPFHGTNGSTAVADVKGSSWSSSGSFAIKSDNSKFGGSSGNFPSSSAVTRASSADYAFGTGDFTVEFWVYTGSVTQEASLIGLRNQPNGVYDNQISMTGGGYVSWSNGSAWASSSTLLTANTWTHIAVTRASGTLRIFQNGVQVYSGSQTVNIAGNRIGSIGAFDGGVQYYYNGYISDLRITKGVARYTSGFTPPATSFPNH